MCWIVLFFKEHILKMFSRKKRRLVARIGSIQKSLGHKHNPFLFSWRWRWSRNMRKFVIKNLCIGCRNLELDGFSREIGILSSCIFLPWFEGVEIELKVS